MKSTTVTVLLVYRDGSINSARNNRFGAATVAAAAAVGVGVIRGRQSRSVRSRVTATHRQALRPYNSLADVL